VHTTKIGACNGVEEVQQGCSSRGGGTRLIQFESPRWRPKAIQVRVPFKVCRAYSPGTHARKEEDRLLLKFPCNPTRTRSV
jgi:hypothetical protein